MTAHVSCRQRIKPAPKTLDLFIRDCVAVHQRQNRRHYFTKELYRQHGQYSWVLAFTKWRGKIWERLNELGMASPRIQSRLGIAVQESRAPRVQMRDPRISYEQGRAKVIECLRPDCAKMFLSLDPRDVRYCSASCRALNRLRAERIGHLD